MIIRDLQHIETATETEVKGGWATNSAYANAGAQAFGKYTYTNTFTDVLVIKDNFSGSVSSSKAEVA